MSGSVALFELFLKLFKIWPQWREKLRRGKKQELAMTDQKILEMNLDNLSKIIEIMEKAGFSQKEIKKVVKNKLATPLNELMKYWENGSVGGAEIIN